MFFYQLQCWQSIDDSLVMVAFVFALTKNTYFLKQLYKSIPVIMESKISLTPMDETPKPN